MHDLHEANKIFKLVLASAKENNLKKVTKIIIDLGQILEHGQEIQKENLEFNLKLLAANSLVDQVEIVINNVVGNGWTLVGIEGE